MVNVNGAALDLSSLDLRALSDDDVQRLDEILGKMGVCGDVHS